MADDDDEPIMRRKQAQALVSRAVETALTNQLSRKIAAAVGKVTARIDEIAASSTAVRRDARGRYLSPEAVELQEKLEAMRREVDARKADVEREALARKSTVIENALSTALRELGVGQHRLRGAIAIHAESAFVDDETGTVKLKVKHHGYDEHREAAEAIRDWGKTPEGRAFIASSPMPAPGPRDRLRSAVGGLNGQPPQSRAEAKQQLTAAVVELVGSGMSVPVE